VFVQHDRPLGDFSDLRRSREHLDATSLSTAMQKYPPALYVAGPLRLALDEFNVFPQLSDAPRSTFQSEKQLQVTREEVGKYSNALTVDNAMITVVSKSFSGKTDATEKWYGTEYRVRAVPRTTLDRWQNCEPARSLRIDFPSPNKFIPSEAGLQVKYPPNGSSARKACPRRR
jgi:secreted Zn-dependent insulinase-like peptidase